MDMSSCLVKAQDINTSAKKELSPMRVVYGVIKTYIDSKQYELYMLRVGA